MFSNRLFISLLLISVLSLVFGYRDDPIIVNPGRQILQNDVNLEPVNGATHIKEDTGDTGDAILFEVIVGTDDLRLINQTDNFPFRTIGRFENLGCTGFLIRPRVVLTAGHCVYDRRGNGAFFTNLNFSPGMNGAGVQPFGVMEWDTGRVTSEFAFDGDDNLDYGIVILKESFVDVCNARGFDNCQKLIEFADTCSDRTVVLNIAGYRDDLEQVDKSKMWVSPCRDIDVSCGEGNFAHTCDTTAGMAGAPMWLFRKPTDTEQLQEGSEFMNIVRGIHIGKDSNNNTVNQAVTVNDALIARVEKWISEAEL